MNNTKKKGIKTKNKQVGNLGEDMACVYLEKHGYTIVDRNYLKKYGEIDIVALKGDQYHFVEVKSVTHETGYRPEENVHGLKIKRLKKVIQAYILEKDIESDWQVDVITVVLNMETRLARVTLMDNVVL